MAVDNIYDLTMRLAVSDEATRILVELGKTLARLSDQALATADALAKIGDKAGAAAASIKAIFGYGGAGALALGGGILGGLNMAANQYERLNQQALKFAEAGRSQLEIQKALQQAQAVTAANPLVAPEEAMALTGRLSTLTGDWNRALRLTPAAATMQANLGPKGAEAAIALGEMLGFGAPGQEQKLTKLWEDLQRASFATPEFTPEMALAQARTMRTARATIDPEFLTKVLPALMAGTPSIGGTAGARFGPGMGLQEMQQDISRIAESLVEGKPSKQAEQLMNMFGGAAGMPPHMLREVYQNPYDFVQKAIGPALIAKYGTDPARLTDAISKIFTQPAAALAVQQMLLGGPTYAAARGLRPEESLFEQRRRALGATMMPEEAEAERLKKSTDAVYTAIVNTFKNIETELGPPSQGIKLEIEQNVLGSLQELYSFLHATDKETLNAWVTGLGKMAEVMTAGGLIALLGVLAVTPTGAIVALGALIAGLYELMKIAVAPNEEEGKLRDRINKYFLDMHNRLAEWIEQTSTDAVGWVKNGLGSVWNAIKEWAASLLAWRPWGTAAAAGAVAPGAALGRWGPWLRHPGLMTRGVLPADLGGPTAPTRAVPGARGGWFQHSSMPSPSQGQLETAMRDAVMAARSTDTRPIVVSLNIDGRKISEALSTQLADLMGQPGQSHFHDGWRGWAPPDMQTSST